MKYTSVFVVFVLFVSLVVAQQAAAQVTDCKLCVGKKFYEQGETIVISGKVDAVLEKTPILIQIFRNQTMVEIAQVDVAQDGSFTHTVVADGVYFKKDGMYTVKSTYGISGNVYEVSFEYQTKESTSTTTQIFEVKSGDSGTFDVPYTIRGGTIKNMFIDPDMFALIVQIQTDNDGTLTLDLGREWIDAKKSDGTTDDTYIIQIDGVQVPYQESADADSRVITVQFLDGDSDIEIIGTQVIPEFGTVAMLVLVAAVTTAIVVSARRNLIRIS
ncbi:PEFG-CTERM sorting domain-containing protein [Candidatus Nitrosotenuis cloacae]|uniref:PEFG-CTERM sorting domain-containing protein n=1 Tax=Candidatus Nitrosotenuis cloacae TaxID=1603555 RepID=UPI00227E1486|nr:PEFG-CTERM sorting domain-containing protein [Candidatus Nitrosotenuis cloacae]